MLVMIFFMFYIYVCLTISSPYLLVFGDDCIRGTREQMILQVDLVKCRARAWASLGDFFYRVVLL